MTQRSVALSSHLFSKDPFADGLGSPVRCYQYHKITTESSCVTVKVKEIRMAATLL